MFRLSLGLCVGLLSVAAHAASCQDQTGNYVSPDGLELQIRQNGCESLSRIVIKDGVVQVTENIIMDGKYRRLAGMPQFLTAFTFDDAYRIGNAKDMKTNILVAIFNSRVSERGDWVQQTIKFDGKGNVLWSKTQTFRRK